MDQSSSIFVNLGSNFLCHFHCIVLSNVSDSRDFSAEETEVPKEIKLMDSSSQGNFYIYINIEYGLTAQENTASLSFLELPNGAQDKINYSSHQSKKKKSAAIHCRQFSNSHLKTLIPYIPLYPRLHMHGLELNPIFLLPLQTSPLLLL